MLPSEFEFLCDENLSIRRIDISTFLRLLQIKNFWVKENEILRKNFIVFLYANWQWYIDECSKLYLEYVNIHCSKWICKLDTTFHTWNLKINVFKDQYINRLCLKYDDFIKKCIKELRFNPSDIYIINWWKNTDFSNKNNFKQSFSYIIDNWLVDLRNDIAHWKKSILIPSNQDIIIIVDFLFKILEKYKEFLVFHISCDSFLKK